MNIPPAIPGLATAPRSPRFINLYQSKGAHDVLQRSALAELGAGLLASSAMVAPKYFYNALGSTLFEAITRLDEYYPTRTEAAIFDAMSGKLVTVLESAGIGNACLIDLGAGNCAKATGLMPFIKPRQYVPVDISVDFLRDSAQQVQNSFPPLDILGVGMDFSAALTLPEEVQRQDRIFFYPGSSLGNFAPPEALQFLKRIASPGQGAARGLLLGIDLVKDASVLEAAYDDALGVTAAFNKNMLLHVNSLLGADFDIRQWRHVALFNQQESRIEMHLEARCSLAVHWPGNERCFAAGERMLTEYSYKYTQGAIEALLDQAGFRKTICWTDPKNWFAVLWAEA